MRIINIALPCDSKQGLGGGFSFRDNFIKGLTHFPEYKYVECLNDADICLIAGATMVTRHTIDKIQELKKKLIVRLDNVPRNSRNRNTGTSRMTEFANRADLVVWQCQWAKDYVGDVITNQNQTIIYNGVDTAIFKPDGEKNGKVYEDAPVYLYSRFNRDETKNWEVAWYEFQMINKYYRKNGEVPKLVLVGKFSPEHAQYKFDFFRGERVQHIGVVYDKLEMAKIMRSCKYLMATYFNDCYSNTYLEALMCGMNLTYINRSGGTPELLDNYKKGKEFNGLKRMVGDYIKSFQEFKI